MAQFPSTEELEGRILGIFSHFHTRSGQALFTGHFLAKWPGSGFQVEDIARGMESLVGKGFVEQKGDHPGAFYLTDAGFRVM